MKTFTLTRTDINKVVLRNTKADDATDAVSKYVSALMLAGIIRMSKKGASAEVVGVGADEFKLANGWLVRAEEVA